MSIQPVLSPPGWYLMIRPEWPYPETGLTRWSTTTCHCKILNAIVTETKAKAQLKSQNYQLYFLSKIKFKSSASYRK